MQVLVWEILVECWRSQSEVLADLVATAVAHVAVGHEHSNVNYIADRTEYDLVFLGEDYKSPEHLHPTERPLDCLSHRAHCAAKCAMLLGQSATLV